MIKVKNDDRSTSDLITSQSLKTSVKEQNCLSRLFIEYRSSIFV